MIKNECDVSATINNIYMIMYEKELTEAGLARELNASRQALHNQLNKRNTMPKLEWLYPISEILDTPLSELIILRPKEDL